MNRYVYIVKSGSLNTDTEKFDFWSYYYFSSFRKATAEAEQIIKVNGGSDVVWNLQVFPDDFQTTQVDYIGNVCGNKFQTIRKDMRIVITREGLR